MSHTYEGVGADATGTLTLPSDGDGPIKAADVNPAFEEIANQLAAAGSGITPVTVDFTANGTFSLPANALPVILADGWGSGTGGGGGAGGAAPSGSNCGGGGGGAALRECVELVATPGTDYAVTIAAGPNGGAHDSNGTPGNNTSLGALYVWPGAKTPGQGGTAATLSGQKMAICGGSPASDNYSSFIIVDGTSINFLRRGRAEGGFGASWAFNDSLIIRGGSNSGNYAGGSRGIRGVNSGAAAEGGGPGGGGAAGPGGAGGAGGNGGYSVASSADVTECNGLTGADAPANSGAGGGGGGGAGQSDDSGDDGVAAGGHAGKGGSGRLRVTYFIPTGDV